MHLHRRQAGGLDGAVRLWDGEADILGAVLVADPHERQVLLGTENLRERLTLLIDAVAEVMISVGEPPATAKMN